MPEGGSGAPGGRTSETVLTEGPASGESSRADLLHSERLGIVSYANVAPLHHRLEPWQDEKGSVEFVYGVPSELNAMLLAGGIDLTLVSSIEFLRHRDRLVALPDFSIATLGPVYSVMLFHHREWQELHGATIAVTRESATSVELLRVLLEDSGVNARLVPTEPDLEAMLSEHNGALLIGDRALGEALARRQVAGRQPLVTDLGEKWYGATRLPFTFAVWAAREDRPPSPRLVGSLRQARERGLAELGLVSTREAQRRDVDRSAMQRYLSNFRYYLELPDRDGLTEFGRRALPGFRASELRFWDL